MNGSDFLENLKYVVNESEESKKKIAIFLHFASDEEKKLLIKKLEELNDSELSQFIYSLRIFK